MILSELLKNIDIVIDSQKEIKGLNSLLEANEEEISFLENKKYLKDLAKTKAAAVLIKKEFIPKLPKNCIAIICEEPYITLAKLSKYFAPKLIEVEGKNCTVGENTEIMENVHLGKNSSIGNNCTIMSGTFIGDNVIVGDNTILYPNVVVYRDCKIGNDCIIHGGTVVGSDGFGFANSKDGKFIKIYQNGNVIIGNDVEIGSNCTIDRAVFNSTIIEDSVRIDNLVHIGHNCKVSKGCILVAQVGLSGSSILNEYVVMGGQSATSGHLEIAAFTTVAARGGVTKSIKEPKKSWAGFPLYEHRQWLKLQGKIAKLLK